jgi:hypothetical protein
MASARQIATSPPPSSVAIAANGARRISEPPYAGACARKPAMSPAANRCIAGATSLS